MQLIEKVSKEICFRLCVNLMLEIAESFQITLSTLCTDPVPSLLSASCPAAVLLDEKDFVLTGLCKVMGVIVESK